MRSANCQSESPGAMMSFKHCCGGSLICPGCSFSPQSRPVIYGILNALSTQTRLEPRAVATSTAITRFPHGSPGLACAVACSGAGTQWMSGFKLPSPETNISTIRRTLFLVISAVRQPRRRRPAKSFLACPVGPCTVRRAVERARTAGAVGRRAGSESASEEPV